MTGRPLVGEVLTVSRAGTGAAPVSLGTVTTDVEGGFVLVDTPPGPGSYQHSVVREADGARAGAGVLVWSTETTLNISVSRGTSPGTVTGSVRLSYQGPDTPAGRTITLSCEVAGTVTALPSLTTDAFGGATFTDTPPAGTVTYTASVAANGVHPAKTATSVPVSVRATELTLSVVLGIGITKKLAYVTSHLGGWHTNRTVTITTQPAGGAEVTLASGPVDAAGNLTATYQPRSRTTYRARYAGDDWYAAAVAQRTQ